VERVNAILSPIARRAFRTLLPLALVMILSIGGVVAVSTLFQTPAQSRLAAAQAAYETARQTQIRQEAARKTQEELTAVWAVLPVRTEFGRLILDVSELAQRDRVSIPGITYTLQKMEDGLALKATMTFRAVGQYGAIREFIHRLETTGPYLFIESLDVSRTSRGGAATPVVFNVRVVTFLRPGAAPTEGKKA
jgi:Tfp pilus assembly protein PilO